MEFTILTFLPTRSYKVPYFFYDPCVCIHNPDLTESAGQERRPVAGGWLPTVVAPPHLPKGMKASISLGVIKPVLRWPAFFGCFGKTKAGAGLSVPLFNEKIFALYNQ